MHQMCEYELLTYFHKGLRYPANYYRHAYLVIDHLLVFHNMLMVDVIQLLLYRNKLPKPNRFT